MKKRSDVPDATEQIIRAVSWLPITAQLDLVQTLLLVAGGDKHSLRSVPELVAAHEILGAALKIIATRPNFAKLTAGDLPVSRS